MEENLKEIHEEATRPQSIEEQALAVDLTASKKDIAENNTRPVLVQVLKINGIDHETLNISKSKFNKLNKTELVEILFSKPQAEAKQEAKQSGENTADYLQKLLELKEITSEAVATKDYKKLDSAIASNLIEALSNDEKIASIDYKSPYFTKILIILASIYFIARLYGFEKIGAKFSEIINKAKGAKSDEVS